MDEFDICVSYVNGDEGRHSIVRHISANRSLCGVFLVWKDGICSLKAYMAQMVVVFVG